VELLEEGKKGAAGSIPEESNTDNQECKMIILGDGEIPGEGYLKRKGCRGDEEDSKERPDFDLNHFY
jgi:hypothetical protein